MAKALDIKPVFVNCPFDGQYLPLFHATIFAVVRCGFQTRTALEVVDTTETRINKIARIIRDCPIGIHDISRTELDAENQLPRFNMPFELGLFLGAKLYGNVDQKKKACLVLDRENYRYQKYISDIAGQDISAHSDDPKIIINRIRDFLNSHSGPRPLPSGDVVWEDYEKFQSRLPEICAVLSLDWQSLQFADYLYIASDYVSEDKPV